MFKIKRIRGDGWSYVRWQVYLTLFGIRITTLYRYTTILDPFSMFGKINKYEVTYQNTEILSWLKIFKKFL